MKRNTLIKIFSMVALLICFVPISVSAQSAGENKPPANGILAPAETLSGKIWMVDQAKRLVVVRGSLGVPFDFVVTPSTRIVSSNESVRLGKLSSLKGERIHVRFLPERRGDIAEKINVG